MVEGTGLENVGGRCSDSTVGYPASKFKGFYYGELPCKSTKWKVGGRWMNGIAVLRFLIGGTLRPFELSQAQIDELFGG